MKAVVEPAGVVSPAIHRHAKLIDQASNFYAARLRTSSSAVSSPSFETPFWRGGEYPRCGDDHTHKTELVVPLPTRISVDAMCMPVHVHMFAPHPPNGLHY